jgi:hypothetical protein
MLLIEIIEIINIYGFPSLTLNLGYSHEIDTSIGKLI